ncbi:MULTISPECIES: hypothetical protein [unclassified Streptomyces]|uniref:hypothetical protein n=1 Tax=unclassified Streptomyces TaxID=2593676 RepID=UPI000DB984FF|nr:MULTISPECIES: hypothetical protein [unclassified Streptomyces]MYT74496.1 hypothetical protein [Streptomyces sp. SID8367]RAJ91475.1 hypothetical protein K377_00241 [Streptomyces sp. PsTaAH-137]
MTASEPAGIRRGRPPLTVPRLLLLSAVLAASAVLLILLVDGWVAAGAAAVVLGAGALLCARYVAGADAQDSGRRGEVRLLRTRAPGMGEWHRNVRISLGPDGALCYRAVLRPELRRLFAAALAEHHHVSLDRQPARAAELIGPELWRWLGPEPPATGPDGAIPAEVLGRLVDRLELLGTARTRPRPHLPKEEAP